MDDKKDPVVRPEWVDSRFEWWEGESVSRIVYRLREASPVDMAQLKRALRVPYIILGRWIGQHGYSVWVITRNRRNVIAAIVARHGPEDTTVLRFHCSAIGETKRRAALRQFTTLLQHEVPEWKTNWKVKLADDLCSELRGLGWQVDHSDDETGYAYLYRPALIPGGPNPSG